MNINTLTIAFIADDKLSALNVLAALNSDLSIELIVWEFVDDADLSAFDIVVIGLNLKQPTIASRLSQILKTSKFTGNLILAVDKSSRAEVAQAHALGAAHTIARPINATQLFKTLLDITHIQKGPEKKQLSLHRIPVSKLQI